MVAPKLDQPPRRRSAKKVPGFDASARCEIRHPRSARRGEFPSASLRVAKKTTNHPGFASEPPCFGFLGLVYCPCSPAGVSFPKLALFFCSRKNVPGERNAPLERLRLDDHRAAKSRSPAQA